MSIFFSNAGVVNTWQYASSADIADTTPVAVAAAPGASRRHRVVAIQVTNTDTAVGTLVRILDGSTVIANLFVEPFVVAAPGHAYSQATFPVPLMCTANTAVNVDCVTTSAQVRLSIQGYTEIC